MSDCCHYCRVRSAFSTFSIWRRDWYYTCFTSAIVALRRDRCLRLMRFASSSFLRRRRALPHTIPNVDAGPSFPCLLAGKIVEGRHNQLQSPSHRRVRCSTSPRARSTQTRTVALLPTAKTKERILRALVSLSLAPPGLLRRRPGSDRDTPSYVDLCSFPFVVAAAGGAGSRSRNLGVRTQTTSAYYWNVNFVQICNGSNSCPRRFTR